jgi:transposase
MAIERHFRELDRLGEDLGMLDREIAQAVIDNPAVKRLLTVSSRTMCMKLRSERPK